MAPLRPLVALTLLTTACGAEANYTLQLRPVVPLNQEPFRDGPRVWLGIHDAIDGTTWTDLDVLQSGSARQSGLGPLDGDRVGVALGGPASPAEDPGSVFAYGETAPLDLSTGGDEVELGVLIAESNGVGALSTLDDAAFGAALAVLSNGRAYAFGGTSTESGPCAPDIQRLRGLNSGEWAFDGVRADLPEGLCYAVATVVELDGREQILITGGERTYNGFNQRSAQAVLFDPETESVVSTAEGIFTRARHTVAPLPDGRLLLVGTHQLGASPPSNPSWEVLDPDGLTFGASGTTAIAPWEFMAAPTPGGVALCGGGNWVRTTITPASACLLLTGDGGESPLPPLPEPTRAGAMTRLADGRLLVVGGIHVEGQAGPALAGSDTAWILDPDGDAAWTSIGPLNSARAYPVVIPDRLGGALILGGAEAAWGFGTTVDGPADCGERLVWDGDDARFEPMDSCGEGGTGVLPSVSVHPSFGALLLEGRRGSGDGGAAVGFVPVGPEL